MSRHCEEALDRLSDMISAADDAMESAKSTSRMLIDAFGPNGNIIPNLISPSESDDEAVSRLSKDVAIVIQELLHRLGYCWNREHGWIGPLEVSAIEVKQWAQGG